CSTAVTTASGRWVKVAQPRPYRPGSLVSTFTTTRRMPSGAVQIVLTLVILRAGRPPDGSQAGGMAGWIESGVGVSGIRIWSSLVVRLQSIDGAPLAGHAACLVVSR